MRIASFPFVKLRDFKPLKVLQYHTYCFYSRSCFTIHTRPIVSLLSLRHYELAVTVSLSHIGMESLLSSQQCLCPTVTGMKLIYDTTRSMYYELCLHF